MGFVVFLFFFLFLLVGPCVCVQENIPIEEVFENLRCSKEGLTSEAAGERLAIFGHNKLEEKKARSFTLLPLSLLHLSLKYLFLTH